MSNSLKSTLRSLTPPLIWKSLAKNSKKQVKRIEQPIGEEKPAEYYEQFGTNNHLLDHYTQSRYYPTWLLILDRLAGKEKGKILDIGCGPGQFSKMLVDNNFEEYLGIDFSKLRISQAKKTCPEYTFLCKDIYEKGVLENIEYETVIMTEFLEHVTEDVLVIKMLKEGARIFGTVPNYGGRAHVRKYESPEVVIKRYGKYFDQLKVRKILLRENGHSLQFFEGVRNSEA